MGFFSPQDLSLKCILMIRGVLAVIFGTMARRLQEQHKVCSHMMSLRCACSGACLLHAARRLQYLVSCPHLSIHLHEAYKTKTSVQEVRTIDSRRKRETKKKKVELKRSN